MTIILFSKKRVVYFASCVCWAINSTGLVAFKNSILGFGIFFPELDFYYWPMDFWPIKPLYNLDDLINLSL